ncbi:MAG: hypothetical protein LRY27_00290 [Chitinophagales bacterium]|nr:hypothetical protein [Chitinophagales bacterium]
MKILLYPILFIFVLHVNLFGQQIKIIPSGILKNQATVDSTKISFDLGYISSEGRIKGISFYLKNTSDSIPLIISQVGWGEPMCGPCCSKEYYEPCWPGDSVEIIYFCSGLNRLGTFRKYATIRTNFGYFSVLFKGKILDSISTNQNLTERYIQDNSTYLYPIKIQNNSEDTLIVFKPEKTDYQLLKAEEFFNIQEMNLSDFQKIFHYET